MAVAGIRGQTTAAADNQRQAAIAKMIVRTIPACTSRFMRISMGILARLEGGAQSEDRNKERKKAQQW